MQILASLFEYMTESNHTNVNQSPETLNPKTLLILPDILDAFVFVSQSHPLLSSLDTLQKISSYLLKQQLCSINIASMLHQRPVFMFLRQRRHTATKNFTNCTSCTMEPRLHNAQEISQHSQLHNAHIDVNVVRVATNKSEYCNPNHFNIPI